MGKDSKIEWCDHTFNGWYGCQKVGPGCDHCYAEGWANRFGQVKWGPGEPRRLASHAVWRQPFLWNRAATTAARPPRVFALSLGDVFDNAAPDEWRAKLFGVIRETPLLDWILVTKRIGNAAAMLPRDWGDGYHNVILVATVCTALEADRDVPKLLHTPARRRGLSIEPMLGSVSLFSWLSFGSPFYGANLLHWVIAGGESGRDARPMNPEWPSVLLHNCKNANIPFFFKQWGEWAPGHSTAETPETKRYYWEGSHAYSIRIGKKRAGRFICGREWNEYPERADYVEKVA